MTPCKHLKINSLLQYLPLKIFNNFSILHQISYLISLFFWFLAVWIHSVEEMQCLKSFLPDFYKREMIRMGQLAPFESRIPDTDDDDSVEDIVLLL